MNPFLRISGPILNLERKSGTFEGRAWGYTEATILVGNRQTVACRLDDDMVGLTVGEEIDFLVSVSGTERGGVKIRALSEYPAGAHAA